MSLVSTEMHSQRLHTPQIVGADCSVSLVETGDRVAPLLPGSRDDITVEEVIAAAKTLEKRNGYGGRQHACRIWNTICVQDSLTSQWAACSCNKVWCNGHVLDEWHETLASAICKKVEASCEGHRPLG